MSVIGTIMEQLKAALGAAAPARKVTRDYVDHNQRSLDDLKLGVFTILGDGQTEMTPQGEYLQVLLIGQGAVGEDLGGSAVEEFEDLMLDDLRTLAAGLDGAALWFTNWRQSRQMERPFAWVAVTARLGPLDLEGVTDPATLADFLTYHSESTLAVDAPVLTADTDMPQ